MNSRAYNRFENGPFGTLIKKSSTQRLLDEINYYKFISKNLSQSMFFPRLIDYDDYPIGTEYSLTLERYGYPNIGEFLVGKIDVPVDWTSIFTDLHDILKFWLRFSHNDTKTELQSEKMIMFKTINEYENFKLSRLDLSELFLSDIIKINKHSYANFNILWKHILPIIQKEMLSYNSSMIHGDFCLSNILYSVESNVFKLIDPRGSYGFKGIYGDPRYDIAKLYHSVDGGYEFFINDAFNLKCISHDEYELILNAEHIKYKALKEFESIFFPYYNKKHIKIIEGCIFIGMCARHYDNKQRQLAMYLTGVRILNEAVSL